MTRPTSATRTPVLRLQELSELALAVSGLRSAAVHVFDEVHQHRLAGVGTAARDLDPRPRATSLCDRTARTGLPVLTPDVRAEEGLLGGPEGEDPVRTFASLPLTTSDGVTLGALCAYDAEVRPLTLTVVTHLSLLAAQAAVQLELVLLLEQARTGASPAGGPEDGERRSGPSALRDGESLEDIRTWARAQGVPVSSRGSLSQLVVRAYRAAVQDGDSPPG